MANYGQQINFVASLTTNVIVLLTGSRGGTRTHDTHRMKVLHLPLCYSTVVPLEGIDPSSLAYQANALPLSYKGV